MKRKELIKIKLFEIISEISKNNNINESDDILNKLGINGDDSYEFFEKINNIFGTKLNNFKYEDYFHNDFDAFIYFIFKKIKIIFFFGKFKDFNKKKITVRHLIDVIERGEWYEDVGNNS